MAERDMMSKGRLEAFSDGVIAIIITIMVLEIKAPHGSDWDAVLSLVPVFLSYVLSFLYVGIYWNNHHHLFQIVQRVSGGVLWANLHLLFWLSLIPLVTRWMGESQFTTWPVVAYGVVLFCCAMAWEILVRVLLRHHGPATALAKAVGKNFKEWLSLLLYALALGSAFYNTFVASSLYTLVAVIWIIPDRRFEKVVQDPGETTHS